MSSRPDRSPDVEAWREEAIRAAARFIARGARVLDLSGTASGLAAHLPFRAELLPASHVAEAPSEGFNLAVAIESLRDPARAADEVAALRRLGRPVIVALPPVAAQALAPGGEPLTMQAFLQIAAAAGFARARMTDAAGGTVMRLEPTAPAYRPERSVWVLSYSNLGNFGDRLGHHLVSHVLPPNARVARLHHDPWDAPADGEPDLLIVGIGNSLFQPLLTDDLLALMDRAKACIGVFGTQYREAIDPGRLDAVLDRCQTWWARNEADLFLYAQDRANAQHLGDWLIDAFPLAQPTVEDTLMVGDEVWDDQPLDRTIQRIQSYAQVATRRLHPLLCALTSARRVAYNEQRELSPTGAPSGKFRSMLIDIFGQERPEGEFWDVDMTAVADYKAKVRENVGRLRDSLARMLN